MRGQKRKQGEEEKRRQERSSLPASLRSARYTRRFQQGFTLLEVLVALVIFGILTVALSNAMSTALRARMLAEARQDDSATVRAIFGILGRDLQSAYASVYDPNSLFVAGGATSGNTSSSGASGSLLTMASLSHRLNTTDPNVDPSVDTANGARPGSVSNSQNGSNDPPQSPVSLIRYDFDPQSGVLSRVAQSVPSLQNLQQATPGPDDVVASNIISLQLQYWDPTQQNWRDAWDYEQPNLPPSATAATTLALPLSTDTTTTAGGAGAPTASVQASGTSGSTSGAAGGASGTSGSASSGTNANGGTGSSDLGLPSAVQITLVIRKRDGTPGTYSTILPLATPTLQDYPYVGGQTVNPTTTQTQADGQAKQQTTGQ